MITENNIPIDIINITEQMDISKLSKLELLEKCKELGITKSGSKNKLQLIELIGKNKVIEEIPRNTPITPITPITDADTKTFNVIDLFCGCGGMSKGLTDAGLNVIAGIDIWDKAVESYNKNYHHKAYCADLTELPPEKFNELYNMEGKEVDILVGGPPCQSFSIAGKRDKNDPRNALFIEYVKYLDYFKPKAFIMENVIGLLSKKTANGENVIDIIMEQLNQNYNCIINKLYASDFEVPQNRRRTIIIGIRKDLHILPKEPEPIIKSVQDRIAVKSILIPKEDVDKKYYLSEKALAGIENKKGVNKEKGYGFGAQMLDFDKPSYTIPARYWKDGYDALVKYNEKEIRRLTITELKRIQSFPDNYIIEGSNKDIIMQIGNAVACKFAYYLGKYIIDTLTPLTLLTP
uniref:DNA (cytosine-5-)-methyltransferase n=1 Tax=viral metagenome TaxID=1070528 RepID=A0A6C0LLK0_9ZZZZ